MRRLITLIFIHTSFVFTGCGQSLNVKKLDSLFNSLASRDLAMGSLTISKNGIVQYKKAIGYSFIDNNKKARANINTKYRVGSISKMFTAVMVFQLIEEGKINLNQKLNAYYPNLPNADEITIRNLLYHRSGLHDYTKGTNFPEWMDKYKTHEDLLNIIIEKGADFEPDAKADYSSTNYLLLGYIIERVCKMSYGNALEKRIVSKIGLHDTYYGNAINTNKNESTSYKYSDDTWKKEKETNLNIHGGAGSIVSTPTDMVKFIDGLFAYKLVSQPSLDNMKTLIDGYGMGMFSNMYGSKSSLGHNGRVEEFYSALWYFPGEKLSVAYCTNGINYPRVDIIERVLKICFNERIDIPFSNPINLKSQDLDKFLGKYSSDQMPLIVTCTKENTKLFVETKGKVFDLKPVSKNYFMHAPTGYFFEFNPKERQLLVKETDNVYSLKRRE